MYPFRSGPPRRPKPTLESVPRLLPPPSRGRARETVTVTLGGVEHRLEIIRQPRIHGTQGYWTCNRCGRLCWYLHIRGTEIACRKCFSLTYASQRTRHGAALRAAKIRRRLGAAPGLLGPLPPRPRNVWARAYHDKLVRKLAICEAAIAQRLGRMVERKRRRRR